MTHALSRRAVLGAASLGGLYASGLPGLAFAAGRPDAILTVILLRGAMDGLNAVVPYADPAYAGLRRQIAIPTPGTGTNAALKLDGLFALNPALVGMKALYDRGQLLPVHALHTAYRERSHFAGQDVLENGATSQGGASTGWLNRALTAMPAGTVNARTAVAFAQAIPLILRGPFTVSSYSADRVPDPDADTLNRVLKMYEGDAVLKPALEAAMAANGITRGQPSGGPGGKLGQTLRTAAGFMKMAGGPRVAVVEVDGWDTHANQGATSGALFTSLKTLDDSLKEFERVLGPEFWAKSVVVMVTEFGRTAAVNGTGGTDHGTASAGFLAGGAVRGGRVLADWPGLGPSQLYQGRDLAPTTDMRGLLKGVLLDHLGVPQAALDTSVFPGSAGVRVISGLIGAGQPAPASPPATPPQTGNAPTPPRATVLR